MLKSTQLFKKRFYLWWLSVLLLATTFFWAAYAGIVKTIWETDVTMITSVIVLAFLLANILLARIAYYIDDSSTDSKTLSKDVDTIWFASEQLMALGMFGTVIGLIHMLGVNIVGQAQDTGAIQDLLTNMWASMGLALYANAVGLFCSIILKVQVHFIAGDIDDASQKT